MGFKRSKMNIFASVFILSLSITLSTLLIPQTSHAWSDDPSVNTPISTAADEQNGSAIAFGGTSYLIIWLTGSGGINNVYGQLVDTSGFLIGSEILISTSSGTPYGEPDIVFDGTNFLVVWMQYPGQGDVYGQFIDQSSFLIGSNFPISAEAFGQFEPVVEFDGTNYLVVWEDYRSGTNWDIYGQFVNTSGLLVGPDFPISVATNSQLYPDIAFDGTNYLVVWPDGRPIQGIYGQFVAQDGTLIGSNFKISAGPGGEAAIAFDGTDYLVVWRGGSANKIYGQFVDTSGLFVGSNILIYSSATFSLYVGVAFDGSNYLVVWGDGLGTLVDLFGQFVNTSGSLVGSDFEISTAADDQIKPAITFGGSNYVVVWEDFRSGTEFDIYGQAIDRTGRLLGCYFLWDDVENGDESWTHYADQGVDIWTRLIVSEAHSPTHCWLVPAADTIKDDFLVSWPFGISSASKLIFWHTYDLQAFYDGAVVEISTNGGSSWIDLGPNIIEGGYDGIINSGTGSPIAGRMAWTGGTIGTMTRVVIDLSSFAGFERQIRFRIACDESLKDSGWGIDTIQVTSDCTSLPAMDGLGVIYLLSVLLFTFLAVCKK